MAHNISSLEYNHNNNNNGYNEKYQVQFEFKKELSWVVAVVDWKDRALKTYLSFVIMTVVKIVIFMILIIPSHLFPTFIHPSIHPSEGDRDFLQWSWDWDTVVVVVAVESKRWSCLAWEPYNPNSQFEM